MRYPAPEKLEIIRLVEQSICRCAGRWLSWGSSHQGSTHGMIASRPADQKHWKTRCQGRSTCGTAFLTPYASESSNWPWMSRSYPHRELATDFTDTAGYFVSEASVYRLLKALDLIASPAYIVMKAADEFKDKTTAPNQLWQTDFTYLKVTGWGWFYLSTVLDDFSRYIIASKLCTTMKAQDVTDTLDLALAASGCDQARVVHKLRLLSDNGSSYVSADLAEWLEAQSMGHVRGAPYHPQTQGKIERWHQTLKNRILLENYYLPGDLEASIGRFVDHYNYQRYHESQDNLTPADVYFGRGQTILLERERIKRNKIQKRRLQHQKKAA